MRRLSAMAGTTLATFALLLPMAGPAHADPPGIPSAQEAADKLQQLVVAPEENEATYDRDLFPHWITVSGACNTRETVLKRDGVDVVTNSSCAAVSGSWYSPYDGATWTAASDIDIDHMVPLSEAWKSGAWAWTTAQRRAFANSLGDSQLWSVTDNVNQGKGDKDPSVWRPPLESFYCTYSRSWIDVKYDWGLTAQQAEVDALEDMLATC
ncbi:HNH endonuclease family protein [Spongiactinospora sp. TRM90649]|uniref:HNH endonuclease family protein n=1 Tax=Spongiactinospora sp. TRM90649 TaxID=3031114 RepID=UPI0023F75595|nr:HNH endonuclease family protein [Spongiactinospora sp. TRM90649]MDF5758634.1 HNH endonuclease family protein [Spongiactinospora sp. TRM90649]